MKKRDGEGPRGNAGRGKGTDKKTAAETLAFELDAHKSAILAAAREYIASGWLLMPLDGKLPLRLREDGPRFSVKDATRDIKRVERWLSKHPRMNLGGTPPNGMAVVDLDIYKCPEKLKPIAAELRALGGPVQRSGGGWIDRPGCNTFNLYRAPLDLGGDPDDVQPWLDHIELVFPESYEHILDFLAHRVQRPGVKINHALVLGGNQGIGKDTLLEPVKHAVGPWNFADVSPAHVMGRFNGYIKSTVLRLSEARDLGEVDRYTFYEHLKTLTASPPDVLRCDEKNRQEYAVFNVTAVIITTNHKSDGIHLPPDDRRHYVAWSDKSKEDFKPGYWRRLYGWYAGGGYANVAAYLRQRDLSKFDPKAPPPKTAAFHEIVNANRAPEEAALADLLDACNRPEVITLERLVRNADRLKKFDDLLEFLTERKSRRQIPHRLADAGYVPVLNPYAKDGDWKIAGRRQRIYGRRDLDESHRQRAAAKLCR